MLGGSVVVPPEPWPQGSMHCAVQTSDCPFVSHASPAAALTTPSPHIAVVQSALQVALSPPVSQSSPAWTILRNLDADVLQRAQEIPQHAVLAVQLGRRARPTRPAPAAPAGCSSASADQLAHLHVRLSDSAPGLAVAYTHMNLMRADSKSILRLSS